MKLTLANHQTPSTVASLWVLLTMVYFVRSENVSPLPALLNFVQEYIDQIRNEPSDEWHLLEEYDFIIVGAGTAGRALANRLTEISDWSVLLIEAGGHEDYIMDIPLVVNYLQFTPANWGYKTEPSDKYCLGFNKNQCHWPRGRVMGGSSVLNYMIYTRGSQHDYDRWKDMGNDGWGWDDVVPYFKKVENFKIPDSDDPEYHNDDGHVNVEYAPFRTKISEAWIGGAKDMGFEYRDYNGAHPSGVSYLQLSMENGTRDSSSRAYLHPINERKNLHVSKLSLVTKLILNDSKTKVIGVELEKILTKHKIYARKEVISAAGAINSPQLLMLSGIGPKDHLEEMNIEVVKDLSVGHNLMDHIAAGGIQFIVEPQNVSISFSYVLEHFDTVFDWMKNKKGPLTVPGACEAILFTALEDKYNASGWPDLELLFIGAGLNNDKAIKVNFNFDPTIYEETYGSLGDSETFMVFPMLLRPKSKGRILLDSKNPRKHPKIIPNYFEYDDDLKTIVEGIKLSIDIAKQSSMKDIDTKFYDVPIQECLVYGPFGSDEYFACQARMFTLTIYHQSGTCKMGPANDSTSVVDSRLRVHGIDNLRVMDASIMPEIPAAHTNAAVYMIAEKGADMVKEDWGKL